MSLKTRENLKEDFLTGNQITQQKMHDFLDSFLHQEEDGDEILNSVGLTPGQQAQSKPIPLPISNPRIAPGFEAQLGSVGNSPDGRRWLKTGAGDEEWEEILISKNGKFSANITLSDSFGVVPDRGAIARIGGGVRLGDGFSDGGRSLPVSQEQLVMQHASNWMGSEEIKHSVCFISTSASPFQGSINLGVTNGATHVKLLRWDGTWTSPESASEWGTNISWGAAIDAPYTSRMVKFGACCPCTSDGTPAGNFSRLSQFGGYINAIHFNNLDFSGGAGREFNFYMLGPYLDFSNPAVGNLETLWSEGGRIKFADFSGIPQMTEIRVYNNSLEYIIPPRAFEDANSGPIVDLQNNNMSASALNEFFLMLPETTPPSGVVIDLRDNPGSSTCDPDLAPEGYIIDIGA